MSGGRTNKMKIAKRASVIVLMAILIFAFGVIAAGIPAVLMFICVIVGTILGIFIDEISGEEAGG